MREEMPEVVISVLLHCNAPQVNKKTRCTVCTNASTSTTDLQTTSFFLTECIIKQGLFFSQQESHVCLKQFYSEELC